MKDKGKKLEDSGDVKAPHTLGGASYILFLYINSAKEVVSHLEVELYNQGCLFIITEKARVRERKLDGVGVTKDKELKLEEVKAPRTLGGASYILRLYINSVKEVVSHLEVELYKPRRYIILAADSARGWV
jgi:hypothetical protein